MVLRDVRQSPPRDELRTPAERLWQMGSLEGAQACGFKDAGGGILIGRDAVELALVEESQLLDAVVYSGSAACVVG